MTKTSLSIKKDEFIMTKFECDCPNRHCHAENTQNDKPSGCLFGDHESNWIKSGSGDGSSLPKLTAAVFDREDFPEWARFAAVDCNGEGWLYSEEPILLGTRWGMSGGCGSMVGNFDASRWRNSLIDRPEKPALPAWCTVGAWVWYNGNIGKIAEITADVIRVLWVETGITEDMPYNRAGVKIHSVTWLAWTHITLPALPVAVKTKCNEYFVDTIVACTEKGVWFARHRHDMMSFQDLFDVAIQLSGLPCGAPVIGEVGR